MRVPIPPDNVAVPLAEFGLVWSAAERLFRASPSRYLGGVVSACRWVAGLDEAPTPIYRSATRATPASILVEDMLATTISMGGEPDSPVARDWAAGVAMTLGWVRGALDSTPITHDRPVAV